MARHLKPRHRKSEILALWRQGHPVSIIVERTQISRSAVYRVLGEARARSVIPTETSPRRRFWSDAQRQAAAARMHELYRDDAFRAARFEGQRAARKAYLRRGDYLLDALGLSMRPSVFIWNHRPISGPALSPLGLSLRMETRRAETRARAAARQGRHTLRRIDAESLLRQHAEAIDTLRQAGNRVGTLSGRREHFAINGFAVDEMQLYAAANAVRARQGRGMIDPPEVMP